MAPCSGVVSNLAAALKSESLQQQQQLLLLAAKSSLPQRASMPNTLHFGAATPQVATLYGQPVFKATATRLITPKAAFDAGDQRCATVAVLRRAACTHVWGVTNTEEPAYSAMYAPPLHIHTHTHTPSRRRRLLSYLRDAINPEGTGRGLHFAYHLDLTLRSVASWGAAWGASFAWRWHSEQVCCLDAAVCGLCCMAAALVKRHLTLDHPASGVQRAAAGGRAGQPRAGVQVAGQARGLEPVLEPHAGQAPDG